MPIYNEIILRKHVITHYHARFLSPEVLTTIFSTTTHI